MNPHKHLDTLETRDFFKHGLLTVAVRMVADEDATPEEFECYSTDDIAARFFGRWQFVGLSVTVTWDEVQIAEDSIWGVEHGTMGNGVVANAMSLVDALGDIMSNALGDALMWARKAESAPILSGLNAATEWLSAHACQG